MQPRPNAETVRPLFPSRLDSIGVSFLDQEAPRAFTAFGMSFDSTQRIAPYRPPPASIPSRALMPIPASASFAATAAIAPAAGKAGEGKQVYSLVPQRSQHSRPLARLVGNTDLEIVHFANRIGHFSPPSRML